MNRSTLTTLVSLCLFSLTATAQHVDSTQVFRTLDESLVTGWAGTTSARYSPVPVSVIGKAELGSYSSTNIIDALSHQPGISQITTGSAISKPVIRGLGYNRVIVVNDGIRQEGQQWGDEHGIEVDPQSVNSVEIIKGPASLLYGSDAMSGVIIFNSAPVPMPGTILASMSNEYQTNNGMIANSIFNAGHIKDMVWDARISFKNAHAYRNKADGFVLNSGFSEQAASGMVGVNKNWGYSHLRLGIYKLKPGLVEGEREDDGSFVNESGLPDRSYKLMLPFQKITHGKVVSESSIRLGEGSLKVVAGYQLNDRQEFEEEEDECSLFFRLHSLNYDVHYRSQEFSGWRILGGVAGMLQSSSNLGEEYLIPEYRLLDIGTFATAQKTFDKWALSGGIRFDERLLHSFELIEDDEVRFSDFHRSFPGLSASIGVSFFPIEGLQLKLDLARGFRAPNISELASNGVHEGTERYELGSESLKSENSLQLDLGLDYTNDKLSLTAALFANRIDNFVFSQRSPGQEVIDDHDLFRFTQGDAFLYGGEIGLCWSILPVLHLDGSFSYVSGQLLSAQDSEQKWLPLIPAPRANLGIKYFLNTNAKALKETFFQVGFENYFRKSNVHSAYGTETQTPAYFLLNASVGTDIMVKGKKLLSISINGENLTNTVYQNHLSRLKYTDVNPATGRMGIFDMGINFGFRLLWNLEFLSY